MPKVRLHLPQPLGLVLFVVLGALLAYWFWRHTGPTGELNPTSRARILFPIWGHTALDTVGHVRAREGDLIVLDYDVKLEAGYFSLSIGKTRWLSRRLLRHAQSRSLRQSASGQLSYVVQQNGWHAIWAGRYSVWRGEARVQWKLVRKRPS